MFDQLKAVRAEGKKAKFHWLWNRARTKLKGEETVIVRKHVITTCLSRYNVRMRARQRNKNKSKDAYRDDFMKWPSVTRERLIRTGGNSDSYNPKWKRFLPFQRFNLDQSSMSFVIDSKETYKITEPGDRY